MTTRRTGRPPRHAVAAVVAGALFLAAGCTTEAGPLPEQADRDAPRGEPSAYRFVIEPTTGKPARFNPCQPLRYVVNLHGAPEGALADVQAGVAEVARATGIEFRYDGPSDETAEYRPPQPVRRAPFQPERYGGDRWAPVLVSWIPLGTTGVAAGGTAVHGLSQPQSVKGQTVTGVVLLNSQSRPSEGLVKRAVMHELAHLLGLDHVTDPYSIVSTDEYAVLRANPRWSAGDLEGLRQLGREGGCLEPVPPGPTAQPG